MSAHPENIVKVGFWNVNRVGNPSLDRWAFADAKLREWISPHGNQPDLLVFAEVTQTGADWAHMINTDPAYPGYSAQFIANEDVNGNVSPCSFMVISRDGRFDNFSITATGLTSRRPYLSMSWEESGRPVVISSCHVIATQGDPSYEEMLTFRDDLEATARANGVTPLGLIGDMNYDVSNINVGDPSLNDWVPSAFGYSTFQNGKVLDYILAPPHYDVTTKPLDPWDGEFYTENDFLTIDHAPISYQLTDYLPKYWEE